MDNIAKHTCSDFSLYIFKTENDVFIQDTILQWYQMARYVPEDYRSTHTKNVHT